jgi:hypothetical protein
MGTVMVSETNDQNHFGLIGPFDNLGFSLSMALSLSSYLVCFQKEKALNLNQE